MSQNAAIDPDETKAQALAALRLVGQLAAAHKVELQEIEATAWALAARNFGAQKVIDFCQGWLLRGAARAPRIQDFLEIHDPSYLAEDAALAELRRLVSRVGPYQTPSGVAPILARAVHEMGGWVHVCETMPGVDDTFKAKQFADRFATAWKAAEVSAMRRDLVPLPLKGFDQLGYRTPAIAGPSAEPEVITHDHTNRA